MGSARPLRASSRYGNGRRPHPEYKRHHHRSRQLFRLRRSLRLPLPWQVLSRFRLFHADVETAIGQRCLEPISVIRAAFLAELLRDLPSQASLPFLGAWAGARAARTGKRVVYSPFLSGISDLDWRTLVDTSEEKVFADMNRDLIPDRRFYPRSFSLEKPFHFSSATTAEAPGVLHSGLSRKLGQHFLIRDSILERLAAAACGDHTPRAIEIGPGRGALTRHLLPRTDELHAVEIDASLVQYLQSKFASEAKLHIHAADVLTTDLAQWGSAVLTGNLPYYITSPIIEKFLALDNRFPVAVFLVQWEVAERLLAGPGTRAYGYLTVATQLVANVELVSKVPRSAFVPQPEVGSAAVLFRRKPHAVRICPNS